MYFIQQDCQLPALSSVQPTSGPTGHATLLTIHGSGFRPAGAVYSYTKAVLGVATVFTHTSLPRCRSRKEDSIKRIFN